MGVRAEHDPRDRDRPEELFERRLGRLGHPRSRLRPEVLNDHLLHVPVRVGELANREQRVDALFARLADTDEQARRERDSLLPGRHDRLEPAGRQLVRRAEMRTSAR